VPEGTSHGKTLGYQIHTNDLVYQRSQSPDHQVIPCGEVQVDSGPSRWNGSPGCATSSVEWNIGSRRSHPSRQSRRWILRRHYLYMESRHTRLCKQPGNLLFLPLKPCIRTRLRTWVRESHVLEQPQHFREGEPRLLLRQSGTQSCSIRVGAGETGHESNSRDGKGRRGRERGPCSEACGSWAVA